MKKKSVLIVDDIESHRIHLAEALQEYSDLEVKGQYANGEQAVKAIAQNKPDLLFLDVEMPGLSGFDVLDQLPDPPVTIIHTSFAPKYSEQAFLDYEAAGLLPKGFSPEQLLKSIRRALQALSDPEDQARRHGAQKTFLTGQIELKSKIGIQSIKRLVSPADIVCLNSDKNQVKYYLLGEAKPVVVDQTLKKANETLGENFIQVEKRWVINLQHWHRLTTKAVILTPDTPNVPIGRVYRSDVKKAWERRQAASV